MVLGVLQSIAHCMVEAEPGQPCPPYGTLHGMIPHPRVVLFQTRVGLDGEVEIFVRDHRTRRIELAPRPNAVRVRDEIVSASHAVVRKSFSRRCLAALPARLSTRVLLDYKAVWIHRLDERVETSPHDRTVRSLVAATVDGEGRMAPKVLP